MERVGWDNNLQDNKYKIHAVKMIQQFFMTDEILQLLKAYCYPSLYYASSVWLTPSLNAKLKSNLFLASGKILSTIEVDSYIIFIRNLQELHWKCGKITNLQFYSTISLPQNFLSSTGNYCKATFSKTYKTSLFFHQQIRMWTEYSTKQFEDNFKPDRFKLADFN